MSVWYTTLRPPNPHNPYIKAYVRAVEEGGRTYHVRYYNNAWGIRKLEEKKPFKFFCTQKEAAEYGKKLAKKEDTDLFVYGKDGRMRLRFYYSEPIETV